VRTIFRLWKVVFADSEDRFLYHEITFRFNATVFQQIFDFHLEEIDKVKDLQGMFPVIVMQPVSEISRRGNEKNGGNPFGFSDSDGPLCGTYFLLPFSPSFLWWNSG
jgi:hypothetical protein